MDPYQNRRWIIILFMFVITLTFIIRLLFVQVLDHRWYDRAQDITKSEMTIHPSRGLIYDRNGDLLVAANQVYDLMVTPNEIGEIDTLVLCELLKITKEDFDKKIEKASTGYNVPYKASIFIPSISKEEYARIAPRLSKFNGLEAQVNTNRGYPQHNAAHILGYIQKISAEFYKYDQSEGEHYYNQNDYVGVSGLEKFYEKQLRGLRGKVKFLRDYAGNQKTNLEEILAISGENLYATIDGELQSYGERLMQNKLGCIVAIEPSSGEILSMVSAPSFDPEMLSGRDFSKNYAELNRNDTLKPLINRAIYNDSYRPGSIFKLVQALIAMQEGVITENTGFTCDKSLIGCHNHEYPANVKIAIKHSCNPYFYQVYKRLIQRGEESSIFKDSRIGLTKWRESVMSFGLGTKLGTDIPGVKTGFIPDVKFYDKWYGENRWAFSTIYSNSIGEGEIGVSPLQMANLAAILANRGYYYTPHFIKRIGEDGKKLPQYTSPNYTVVDSAYFRPVVDAMEQVVLSGTGRNAQVDSVSVCGKTGTVENKNFNDHSVFIAFAPKNDPKIAVAVYVEYGTWGGTWAAPIASLMIEKYLKGELSERAKKKENRVLKGVILDKHAKF